MLITESLKTKEHFSSMECSIADYILKQKEQLENQSARYIATQLYTVPSTISRFCQKVGYSGFNEFKKAYLSELSYLTSHFHTINPNYPFDYQDESIVIANKIGQLYQETLGDTLALIKKEELQKAIDFIKQAQRIYVFSAGIQAEVAKTFQNKLLKIGKDVSVETKMDECFYRAMFCDVKSVFIIISYSGETDTILRVAKQLKERHIHMIVISTLGENALSRLASVNLPVSTREKMIENLGNFSMNLSTLFLLDILYANIFNDDFQQNYQNKVASSKGFEQYRTSYNPLIKDES